jgi:hypothetical protein
LFLFYNFEKNYLSKGRPAPSPYPLPQGEGIKLNKSKTGKTLYRAELIKKTLIYFFWTKIFPHGII